MRSALRETTDIAVPKLPSISLLRDHDNLPTVSSMKLCREEFRIRSTRPEGAEDEISCYRVYAGAVRMSINCGG
jgi:hypothetical protein